MANVTTRNLQFPPRFASWMEEMEKRSDRHIRDLVAHTAFKGLDANEIGCARISVMAGSNCPPSKGRIQMSKTNYLQIFISDLQRTAGPYRCAMSGSRYLSPHEHAGWNVIQAARLSAIPPRTAPGLQHVDKG